MNAIRNEAREQQILAKLDRKRFARLGAAIYNLTYRMKHRARISRQRREYRTKNREMIARRKAEWAIRTRAERNRYRLSWSRSNPQKQARYRRNWKDSNLDKLRDYTRRRMALIRGANPAPTIFLADIAARDKNRCGICGRVVAKKDRSLDHRVPVSRGGQHVETNVQLAHKRCNFRKGNRFSQPVLELS